MRDIVCKIGVGGMGKRMETWIACLIGGLDEYVDEETRVKVLERCGRQCQSKSFIKKAKDICEKSDNIGEFLTTLGKYTNIYIQKQMKPTLSTQNVSVRT